MDKNVLTEIVNKMTQNAPELLTRRQVQNVTEGLLKVRHLANLDARNVGIVPRFRIGGRVVYPRQAVIDFLVRRSR